MAAIQILNSEWGDSVGKRNKFERSYGETAANTSGTSGPPATPSVFGLSSRQVVTDRPARPIPRALARLLT
jgi:hypothetical protein